MTILLFLVFGLVIGAIAGIVVPGPSPRGWVTSMVIGVAGAMVGGLLGSALGLNTEGSRSGFLVSVLGALCWLGLYHLIRRRALISTTRVFTGITTPNSTNNGGRSRTRTSSSSKTSLERR